MVLAAQLRDNGDRRPSVEARPVRLIEVAMRHVKPQDDELLRSWRRGLATAAAVVLTAAVLTALVLARDTAQEPAGLLPSSAHLALAGERPQARRVLEIPDELWHDGFFFHRPVDLGATTDTGRRQAAGAGEDLFGEAWLLVDWPSEGFLAHDPFAVEYGWGLGALEHHQLRALDELLGG
jgi:hypothetical protein